MPPRIQLAILSGAGPRAVAADPIVGDERPLTGVEDRGARGPCAVTPPDLMVADHFVGRVVRETQVELVDDSMIRGDRQTGYVLVIAVLVPAAAALARLDGFGRHRR